MFERLGVRVFAHRKRVLIAGLVLLILGGLWGGSVSKHLSSGGYYDPHSESVRAGNDIQHKLDVPTQDAVVLFTSQQPISDPTVEHSIETALASLPRAQVPSYTTYWTSHQPQQLSTNGRATYVTLSLTGKSDAAQEYSLAVARSTLAKADLPGITVQYGGTVTLNKEISGQVSTDLRRAELVSLPIVLVLLIIIFGSLVSAGLPLAVGILAIVGASAVLRLLTTFVSVSVFALNLVTVLGLGLAVDYALVHRQPIPRGTRPATDGAARADPHDGDGRANDRILRRDDRGVARLVDPLSRDVPAIDGLRRRCRRLA